MTAILLAYILAIPPPTGCAPIDGAFVGALTVSNVPAACAAGHLQPGDVLTDERTFTAGQQTASLLDAAMVCTTTQTDCSVVIDCTRTVPISGRTLRMYYDLTFDGASLAGTAELSGTALACPFISFGFDATK